MIAVFKEKSPANILWLLLLSLALHSNLFVHHPQLSVSEKDGLVSLLLMQYGNAIPSFVMVILYHGILLFQALRINQLFNDQRMFVKPCFVAAMTYLLVTGLFKEWGYISPALIANSLIIWVMAKIIRLYNHANPKTLLFNIGLITGFSIILYHPTAVLSLVVLFAVLVVRPFKPAEILVLLIGICTPFYFLMSALYLMGDFSQIAVYLPEWQINHPFIHTDISFWTGVGWFVAVVLTGMYYWQQNNGRMLIQVRKNWGVLLVMLLLMLPTAFINKNAGMESLLLLAVPAAAFAANGFIYPKKTFIPNIFFWLFFFTVLVNNWQLVKN